MFGVCCISNSRIFSVAFLPIKQIMLTLYKPSAGSSCKRILSMVAMRVKHLKTTGAQLTKMARAHLGGVACLINVCVPQLIYFGKT